MPGDNAFTLTCPVPAAAEDCVQVAHGGGGRAMARLLDTIIRPGFEGVSLDLRNDSAILDVTGPLAFTTDSYVVSPLIFPGGDIGSLAINGTVNDLLMAGAKPLYLSVGFILEEGLPLATLRSVVGSMRKAAEVADIRLATGDTKVVDRGKADGIFINTAGVGQALLRPAVGPRRIRPGDCAILSGDIGRHGISIMAAREGFGFESAIRSDCAPLVGPVLALIESGIELHCLRDLTRGGLASACVEIAEDAGLSIALEEEAIPVAPDVSTACELLGFDPLHVANEGRFIAFVPEADAARALKALKDAAPELDPAIVGKVKESPPVGVTCRGPFGTTRAIDMLNGEQLPRIC